MPFALAAPGGVEPAAADAAFYAVFAVFVAAFAVLAAVSIRWAVRRDRAGRSEWVRRQQAREEGDQPRQRVGQVARVSPPRTNGHDPRNPGNKDKNWEGKQP